MQLPDRRPRRHHVDSKPDPAFLELAADRALYVGSLEHKIGRSWLGQGKLRSDATPCPPHLKDPNQLTEWLRHAIALGTVSELHEGDFPRYVWFKDGGDLYEGRLVNRELGEYKGYPLLASDEPKGFRK